MTGQWKKYVGILLPMAVVVAAPIVLRDTGTEGANEADRRLDVITPHNETIRREFGEAFAAYWKEKTGESVYINWLNPGGTSEIKRVLDSKFTAADERGGGGGRDRHLLRGRGVRLPQAGREGAFCAARHF